VRATEGQLGATIQTNPRHLQSRAGRAPGRTALGASAALELKLAGFSYREVMERLGITYTNVNRHLTKGRAELRGVREAA
jgi:hypothetical protein